MKKNLFSIVAACYCLLGCEPKTPPQPPQQTGGQTQSTAPIYTYEVIATYPHDTGAYTQGLQFLDGILYEGTGLNGYSTVRKVDLTSGKVLKQTKNDPEYFGEGIAVLGQNLYQITYLTQKGFVYDKESLAKLDSFTYEGEGWGLTTDGTSLIMSNGSNRIKFIDPMTRTIIRSIEVTDGMNEVRSINELEYINGEIWANIWMTDVIARIDPASGRVTGWINMSGLLSATERTERTDVLNGIAFDSSANRIFVTGKMWPKLFEIKLKSVPRT